jgi:hypothetical protein
MLGISLAATVIAVWLALRGSTEEATQRSASDAAHSAFPSSSQHGETRP